MSVAVVVERAVEWGAVDWEAVDWEAVDWEALRGHRERVIGALPVLRPALEEQESLGARLASEGGGSLSLRERVGVRGARAGAELFKAIAANSPAASAAAARQLAGLGEGSTPAGDDFLVGVMYAVRALLPEYRADSLCTAIAEAAVPLTTRRSAAWLQHASAGNAIPTWNLFLSSLASGDDATIGEHARRVLRLGHTSGRAALSGFVAALDILGGSV